MRRFFFLVLCASVFLVNAQQAKHLRDSILKYQFLNPNLAIEFGSEYAVLRAGDTPDIEMVATYGKMGEILLYMELYSSALEYFNTALRISSSIKPSENESFSRRKHPWIILNIGNIYFKNKNYEKALEKFKEARALFDMGIKPQNRLNGLNTSNSNIGLVYGARGEYEKQEQIYYKVYDNRISNPSKDVNYSSTILYSMAQILSVKLLKDDLISAENKLNEIIEFYEDQKIKLSDLPNSLLTRNYGYVFSIMGAYYQSKKQYGKAIKNLEKAIVIFKSFPVEINVTRSRLSECYLAIDEIDIAEEIALENLNFKNLSDREKRYNFRVLEKIYKKTKKDQKLIKIKDSLILISSGSNSSKIIKSLNDLETQILLSNSARELNESNYLYVLIIGSVILFFSLITIRINYNYQKEKGTRLELEKDKVTQELNQKNRELVSKANFIIQRNDYLKNIQKKISSPQKTEHYSSKMLVNELNRVINSEKSYDEFDRMFINVYPNFYNKLNQINKLSQTDLRLASYIKMNHNNNEIANISGISLRTVESQRYRLTKKLNLDKNQDLNSFLMTL
jgi:tetratricopeptide (TPR) repeat protein